jgi:hypothetical protein
MVERYERKKEIIVPGQGATEKKGEKEKREAWDSVLTQLMR